MNEYDSKLIENLLEKEGFSLASEPKSADVIVINTCSVREKPERKAVETAKFFKKRGKFVVITGCTAQQKGRELLEVADAVVGTRNFDVIPEIVKKRLTNSSFLDLKTICNFQFSGRSVSKILEYVVIQEGCDNFLLLLRGALYAGKRIFQISRGYSGGTEIFRSKRGKRSYFTRAECQFILL
jgi:tRNA-2-methylthio-N6-dimethylallyladenosine synthase